MYEAPTSDLMGAGGKEVWNFNALEAGKTTLSMEYEPTVDRRTKRCEEFQFDSDRKINEATAER